MAFKKRLENVAEFCDLIRNDGDYIISDGVYWRDKKGNILGALEIR